MSTSLSFERINEYSLPVCFVKGGEKAGELVYITESNDLRKASAGGTRFIPSTAWAKYERMLAAPARKKVEQINMLKEAFNKGLTSEQLVGAGRECINVYNKILEDSTRRDIIELPDDIDAGIFQLYCKPPENQMNVITVAGPSGCGKSTMVRDIAMCYKKIYPKNDIYLISKLDKDPVLDAIHPIRIDTDTFIDREDDKHHEEIDDDDEIDDEPRGIPSVDECQDSMIIFDDFEGFTHKKKDAVGTFVNDCITLGRKSRLSPVIVLHNVNNYGYTKVIHQETTHYVLFPKAMSIKQLSYLLDKYVGLTSEQIKRIRTETQGRWCVIKKSHPMFVLDSKKMYLL